MAHSTTEVVICGAGIAGVAAAYHLAVRRSLKDLVLVDGRAPLTLTSDKSMECYRNWFPGPGEAMVRLMNRSIDILEELDEESGYALNMNRRGYLFATADSARIEEFKREAEEEAKLGAGPVRYHTGQPGEPAYQPAPAHGLLGQPIGADLITDPTLIRQHFPYLSEQTIAVLHTRRCGWFSGQQFGMYMLQQAQTHGVKLLAGQVDGIEISGNRVQGVRVSHKGGTQTISTPNFVSAAGPFQTQVGQMIGVELPIFCERHVKIAFNDHQGVVDRHAPLVIWMDPVRLSWSDEERKMLAESEETSWLLNEFPAGVHTRPEGAGDSQIILMQWTYDLEPVEPTFPLPLDPYYPEIVLRGLAAAFPGLKNYFGRAAKSFADGGYYAKTRENRPLIGPLPVEGAYIIGALSGYGVQASSAAGELLSLHVTGHELPAYAPAFTLDRYENPAYLKSLESYGIGSGQI